MFNRRAGSNSTSYNQSSFPVTESVSIAVQSSITASGERDRDIAALVEVVASVTATASRNRAIFVDSIVVAADIAITSEGRRRNIAISVAVTSGAGSTANLSRQGAGIITAAVTITADSTRIIPASVDEIIATSIAFVLFLQDVVHHFYHSAVARNFTRGAHGIDFERDGIGQAFARDGTTRVFRAILTTRQFGGGCEHG
jgi:hypothetical protein